ncbi:MAG: PQQ-binding-like beta-propeller repeat protein, partial [Bacteroidia bacterium]
MKIINVDDLVIWHKKIRNAKGNGPPNYDGLSNPLVVGNQLIVSLFSPGKLLAYDLKTLKVNWQLKYKYLGGLYPQYYKGYIYAGTAQEIYCVSPRSGKVKWTFCPYGRSNEHIYASPVLDGGRVYIGDRWGIFYCLDAKSGKLLWKTQTGSGDNIQVNTSPIIKGSSIYVLNTCGRLEVLAKSNGTLKWFVESDAASIYRPQFSDDSILFHNSEIVE